MNTRRKAWPVVWLLCLGTTVSLAQQPPPRPEKKPKEEPKPARKDSAPKTVDLQVWGIRATTKNSEISPDLRNVADQLKSQFKFTGFKLETRQPGSVPLGRTFTASLTGNYQVKVTPQKVEDKRVTLQIEVAQIKPPKPGTSTTVTVDAGKYQLIGGPALDGGDTLIVAVSGR